MFSDLMLYSGGRVWFNRAMQTMPCAMGVLNLVLAANSGSLCTGLWSPTMAAKSAISDLVIFHVMVLEIMSNILEMIGKNNKFRAELR